MVALLLAAAPLFAAVQMAPVAIACLAIAMGAENAALVEGADAPVALTYMTGTLVKLGSCLAVAHPVGWGSYLLLWCGLLGGATVGAVADSKAGMTALWAGAGCAAILAVITKVSGRAAAGNAIANVALAKRVGEE
jgi:uncharacterized membrane protein YoaK (UPF0700 family)